MLKNSPLSKSSVFSRAANTLLYPPPHLVTGNEAIAEKLILAFCRDSDIQVSPASTTGMFPGIRISPSPMAKCHEELSPGFCDGRKGSGSRVSPRKSSLSGDFCLHCESGSRILNSKIRLFSGGLTDEL